MNAFPKIPQALKESHRLIQEVRRDIHAHPELCFEEKRTADVVAQKLQEWGIPIHRGLGVTGVVGIIKKGTSPRSIGLRADMDALAMQEKNTFAHASTYAGKMHACGHDGHTAMLLAASEYLAKHAQFDGTVYVIFQPAEEGGGGARVMIEDGLFEKFPMEAVFGMHNRPGMPEGVFGVSSGPVMASSNEVVITIKGQGAHAAHPNLGIDPIPTACQIVLACQTIITRNKIPLDHAIISLCMIQGGSASNVIPDECVIKGTVRTFDPKVTDLIEKRMREIVTGTAMAYNCQGTLDFQRNYPATVNTEYHTDFARAVVTDIVGADKVAVQRTSMGSEDFAFMLQELPGAYIVIGNGGGEHRDVGHGLGPCVLHNTSYDFNDGLIPLGATYWANLAQKWLATSKP